MLLYFYLLVKYEERLSMDFVTKLDRLLHDYNLSAYELSKRTGIAEAAISRWRSGASRPNATSYKKISDFFGISEKYFREDGKPTEFSERFDSNMRHYNVSNKKIANLLGTSYSNIMSYRSGNLIPTGQHIEKINDLFCEDEMEEVNREMGVIVYEEDIVLYNDVVNKIKENLSDLLTDDDDFIIHTERVSLGIEEKITEIIKNLSEEQKKAILSYAEFLSMSR